MYRFRLVVVSIVICSFAILNWAQTGKDDFLKFYRAGEVLYNNPNPTNQTDSGALSYYKKVISILINSSGNDSILWDCYFKAAIIEQTYEHFEKAIPLLQACLKLKSPSLLIPGPSWYLPNLYLGNSYYTINRFDSARFYYREAETIATQYSNIEGLERLYNTKGVLNFETGNYRQSKNDFEKAINILESKKNPDINLLVNYKNNLASCFLKLYEYDEAMTIYKSLLPFESNTDFINQNIASVYLNIGASPQAINYLLKVKNNNLAKLNDLGRAYYNQKQFDSAAIYFSRAFLQNTIENGNRKNLLTGITYLYKGDLLRAKENYTEALSNYQQSIQQFIFSFNDSNIYSNPIDYSGVFAVTELYETLLSKAAVFQSFYQFENNIGYLEASLKTFHSLYRLIDYVEKTYESDEARSFINQKKHISHHQPIEVCLLLYKLTGNNKYLEEAFFFDERNKASVLSLRLSDAVLNNTANIPASLIAAERNCKEIINRLSLKASGNNDSGSLAGILSQLREQELSLETIHKKLNDYPAYYQLKFSSASTTIADLQQKIIPSNSAILSYHIGDKNLLCWVISKNNYEFVVVPYPDTLSEHIEALTKELYFTDGSSITSTRIHTRILYDHLLKPVEEKLKPFNHLMIIPDDELSFIPFELLLDNSDQYLLDKFAITYNYSCSLLKPPLTKQEKKPYSLLAFAPYNKTLLNESLPSLPASQKEIEGLNGNLSFGEKATKEYFIQSAPHFSVLHLATHAQTNDSVPLQSNIAFYPNNTDSITNNRLFIPDIYNLRLPNTSLVILSACETGGGQLVKGEGIISLARAFSYAGCPNIVTSQWKADDVSTAYIAHRLHHYLEKGNSIASALQKAKLDYLADPAIEGRFKTPAYWANLRFTGQFENSTTRSLYWLLLLIPLLVVGLYIKKSGFLKSRTRVS